MLGAYNVYYVKLNLYPYYGLSQFRCPLVPLLPWLSINLFHTGNAT